MSVLVTAPRLKPAFLATRPSFAASPAVEVPLRTATLSGEALPGATLAGAALEPLDELVLLDEPPPKTRPATKTIPTASTATPKPTTITERGSRGLPA